MWVNKLSAAVNAKHAKPTPSAGKKLLRNRDQEKKIELRMADKPEETSCTVLPVIDDLLKGMCDGRCLLGILLFYEPTVIQIEGMIYIYHKSSIKRPSQISASPLLSAPFGAVLYEAPLSNKRPPPNKHPFPLLTT